MARQVLLLRHAAVGPEHSGRYLGRTDVPVATDAGRCLARVAVWLGGRRVGRVLCSPLLRARQTAELLDQTIPAKTDGDLAEVDFGRWEGKTFEQISAEDPQHVQAWAQMRDDFAFPEGEALSGFLGRAGRAWVKLAADPADVVLAITHGGVIRSMICHALGLNRENYILFNVQCARCCVIDVFGERGTLSGLNLPAGEDDFTSRKRKRRVRPESANREDD